METVSVSKSQPGCVFKFSVPLQIKDLSTKFEKSATKNKEFFIFSLPLDISSNESVNSSPLEKSSMLTACESQNKRSRMDWECSVCMIFNTPELKKCAACETPRNTASSSTDSLFGHQFKKSTGKWECETCMILNTQEKTKCIACETPRKTGSNSESDEAFKMLASQQKASKWECSTCMTQNDGNHIKCECCEQKKPGHTKKSEETQSLAVSKFSFGFGNGTNGPTENELRKALTLETKEKSEPQFKFGLANLNSTPSDIGFKALASKQKASKWECSTCMTQNDINCIKCVCCEQEKPGHTKNSEETQSKPGTKLSFGFGNGTTGPTEKELRKALNVDTTGKPQTQFKFGFSNVTATPSDIGFKTLASQQKASKWECSTCMVQNDNNSDKCICCEQQKSDQKNEEKLATVSTSPAFRFGFGNITNAEKSMISQIDFQFGYNWVNSATWDCATCLVRNKVDVTKCVCCESVRPCHSKENNFINPPKCSIPDGSETPTSKFKFGFSNANTTPADADFKALASQQRASKWECSSCMAQNDLDKSKCVCCEEPRPGTVISESNGNTNTSGNTKTLQTGPTTNFRFGFFTETKASAEKELTKQLNSKEFDFKTLAAQQRSAKWECSMCMTQNDMDTTKCVCCEEVKSGEKSSELKRKAPTFTPDVAESRKFKFGFTPNTNADLGFKVLADQQKASKWECDACMTHNDNTLLKCACCEQIKPGKK